MGERQRLAGPEDMATTSTAVATVPPQTQEEPVERVAVITLRPTRPETRKKVVWTEDTVDNEHMNKKKSKCCCIYEKPKKFGESDSEDSDDELENCSGHVEKKRGKRYHHHDHDCPHHSAEAATVTITIAEQETVTPEPTATITLQPVKTRPNLLKPRPKLLQPRPSQPKKHQKPRPSRARPRPPLRLRRPTRRMTNSHINNNIIVL
ncbi:E3 ubiquitin-protein ligase PPP1R11 [Helicoverpa armigera]|uniref:E3 ubiquitin-protein ligase PPP1R11 n=1 Tax=Helicoverpa armigera TaxID=29058 RepID=UPI003083B23F